MKKESESPNVLAHAKVDVDIFFYTVYSEKNCAINILQWLTTAVQGMGTNYYIYRFLNTTVRYYIYELPNRKYPRVGSVTNC